jgi:enoyl-CoA hydratase/carnithine racemase
MATMDGGCEHILFAVEDGVATIALDRRERMNAFRFARGGELERTCARCDEDDGVRHVVLTGGGQAFWADADMGGSRTRQELAGGRRADLPDWPGSRLTRLLAR